jgi:hypothetical protein
LRFFFFSLKKKDKAEERKAQGGIWIKTFCLEIVFFSEFCSEELIEKILPGMYLKERIRRL